MQTPSWQFSSVMMPFAIKRERKNGNFVVVKRKKLVMLVDSCKIFKSMTELQLLNLYESKIFYIGLLLGNKIIKVGTQGTLIILSMDPNPNDSNKKNKKKSVIWLRLGQSDPKISSGCYEKIYINQLTNF